MRNEELNIQGSQSQHDLRKSLEIFCIYTFYLDKVFV